MKHIKTFEKIGQSFWVYTRINNSLPIIEDIQIFESKESAENFYINEINEIAKDENNTEKNLIFTYEDAENYSIDNEFAIFIQEVKNLGNYELPEEIKIGRETRKYNL